MALMRRFHANSRPGRVWWCPRWNCKSLVWRCHRLELGVVRNSRVTRRLVAPQRGRQRDDITGRRTNTLQIQALACSAGGKCVLETFLASVNIQVTCQCSNTKGRSRDCGVGNGGEGEDKTHRQRQVKQPVLSCLEPTLFLGGSVLAGSFAVGGMVTAR
jgi:hypothetical protein